MLSSIQTRFYTVLIIVALVTLGVSYWHTARSERALAEDLIASNLHDTAEDYFDSINAFMVTGMMANRGIFQEKLQQRQEIVEARIIRAESLQKMYGSGFSDQLPADDLDRRALNGEFIDFIVATEAGRVYTVVQPIVASADFRGTDCLACHMANEGDILGAVRISASLQNVDNRINQSVASSLAWLAVVLVVAFVGLAWLVHKLIFARLNDLNSRVEEAAKNLDLTLDLSSQSSDED